MLLGKPCCRGSGGRWLPGKIWERSGRQRAWCHAGGSRIIRFPNCLQGSRVYGPEPLWSLVLRSSTKFPKEHVKRFRQVLFQRSKTWWKGLLWSKLGSDVQGWGLNSLCLQEPYNSSHPLGQAKHSWGTQSLVLCSLKHWGSSARMDDELSLREWHLARMQWITAYLVPE